MKWSPADISRDLPKYLALVDALERDVRSGKLAPGERLPPQREIAQLFGVTIATVTKSFAEATRRGLVVTKIGSGTYVANGDKPETASDRPIELGLNLLPRSLCADLLDDAVRAMARLGSATTLGHVGYVVTRQSAGARFARYLSKQQRPLAGDVLLSCHGTQQGIAAALSCLASPGAPVVCEAQTYSGLLRICRNRGLSVVGAEMDEFGVVPDELDRALIKSGARVVVLAPTVQNPTAATMPEDRRREIARILVRRDAFLIEDAVASPLTGSSLPSIADFAPERSIYLTGASKCVASGVRFGLIRAFDTVRQPLAEALISTNWLGPGFFAMLADHLAQTGALDDILARYQADAVARRDSVARLFRLPLSGLPAYHVWLPLPASVNAEMLVAEASAANVHLSTASQFSCANVAPPNAIRLCLGGEDSRDRLEQGARTLSTLLSRPTSGGLPVV